MSLADLRDRIASLPEDNATGSRDFGRGYAKAVRDILELLDEDEEGS